MAAAKELEFECPWQNTEPITVQLCWPGPPLKHLHFSTSLLKNKDHVCSFIYIVLKQTDDMY